MDNAVNDDDVMGFPTRGRGAGERRREAMKERLRICKRERFADGSEGKRAGA